MVSLFSGSSVVWSAFRHGSLAAVRVRASRRSPSGVAVACGFRSWSSAARFAARVPGRQARRVGGLWVVAVPVAGSVPFDHICQVTGFWVRGGVRGCAVVAHSVSICLL